MAEGNMINRRGPVPQAPVTPSGDEYQLPEHRQKLVEAGAAAYQRVLNEKDDLENRLRDANVKIEGMSVQLESLKGIVNMMESTYKTTELKMQERVDKYQRERDTAVERTAKLEAVLTGIYDSIVRHTDAETGAGHAPQV